MDTTTNVIPTVPPPGPEPAREVPKKQGKSLSFWLAIILGFLFLLSIGVNIVLSVLLGANMMQTPETPLPSIGNGNEKFVQGDKNSKNKILLISVEGIIMAQPQDSPFYNKKGILQEIKEGLSRAGEDKNVKGIVLSVNSPGGAVTECDEIYNEIIKFKKKSSIPIVVSMKDVAASGGYYISAPAQKIFAQPTTITGSIGVIMETLNMEALFDKIGLKPVIIKSGKLKDIGSSTRKMSKEEEQLLNSLIHEMSQRFFNIVKEGRKLNDEQLKIVCDARIFTAQQAKDVGLVDEIGYLDDAFKSARDLAGIKDAKLVKVKQNITFFDFLQETSKNLNPKSKLEEKIETIIPESPRLMYLWRQ